MNNCPSCQSDQFKKAALVYGEGHPGAKKSAIAETCAPPKLKEPPMFGNLSMWQLLVVVIPPLIGFGAAGSIADASYLWIAWGGVGLTYLLWKSWGSFKEHQSKQANALAEYDKCFMCLRCGTLSHPFD